MKKIDWRLRFWKYVQKTDGCWNWTGLKNELGYGRLNADGKDAKASRLAWVLHYGQIPKGIEVCHRCDNPSCVRPDHLFLGSHAANLKDAKRKGRINRGSKVWTAKLDENDVRRIRQLYPARTQRSIATEYGVSTAEIYHIVHREKWAWLTI